MKKLNIRNFYEGSFADKKIFNLVFNEQNKKMEFEIKNCGTEDEQDNWIEYKNLKFVIQNWNDFKVIKIDPESRKGYEISYNEMDFLDEVLIYNLLDDDLILEGFGKKNYDMV